MKKLNEALDFKDLGTDLANFQRLVNLYRDLGDNAEEKKKFIEKFNDELNDTGIAINSVAEADKLLIENTPEYIKAITLRAKANAAMKLAATEMEEAVKKQVKNQEKIKELQQQIEDVRGKGEGYKEVIPEIRDINGRILRAAGERTGEEIIAGLQIQLDKLSGASAEAAGQTYLKLMEDYTKQADELIKKTGLTTTDDQAAKNKAAQAAAEAAKARQ
jgi:cupin superfamily acireductone dioxygenase involved in methionine salvage